MYLKIHRGTAQIGGNIIELGTETTRLIFDASANLPPLDDRAYTDSIEIEGLTNTAANLPLTQCLSATISPGHDLFLTAVRGDLAKTDACRVQSFVASGVSEERTPRIYPYFRRYYGRRALVGAASLAKRQERQERQVTFIRTSMLPFVKKYLA